MPGLLPSDGRRRFAQSGDNANLSNHSGSILTLTVLPPPTITKRELEIKVSGETGLTQQQVFDVVQRTMDSIMDALANWDAVVMRNFGAFQVKESKAKIGRNPKDPTRDVPIPPRAMVRFKPGKEMKEKVARVLPKIRGQQLG